MPEDRLRTGDVSFSEYLVCAQYRQEAETVKANGGGANGPRSSRAPAL